MAETTRGQELKDELFYKKKSAFEVKTAEELKDEVKQSIAIAQSKHSDNEVNSWRREKQVMLDAMKELEECENE